MQKNIEVTGISLTNTKSFVLKTRNKNNSIFYIKPKSDFQREIELGNNGFCISPFEGEKSEIDIIKMIESKIEFYTYFDKKYTPVIIVNNNIKSIPNNTTIDNIQKLPIVS